MFLKCFWPEGKCKNTFLGFSHFTNIFFWLLLFLPSFVRYMSVFCVQKIFTHIWSYVTFFCMSNIMTMRVYWRHDKRLLDEVTSVDIWMNVSVKHGDLAPVLIPPALSEGWKDPEQPWTPPQLGNQKLAILSRWASEASWSIEASFHFVPENDLKLWGVTMKRNSDIWWQTGTGTVHSFFSLDSS